MSPNRVNRVQLMLVMLVLLVLQFYVRPRVGNARISPDFLLIALMLFAMRTGPGAGALAGFIVGLIEDTLTPARFGAGLLAHTLVGYFAAWSRALFFSDNMLVNATFVALGLWVRDLVVLMTSGTEGPQLLTELTLYSPLQALTTAGFGVARAGDVPLLVFHPARRMTGFDTYRVRERAEIARLVLVGVSWYLRVRSFGLRYFSTRSFSSRRRPTGCAPYH